MDEHIKKVMHLYGDYLLRIAYTYVKDQQIAQEILQDVFINYYRKSEQFRGEASLKTYLTKMTINRSHHYLRSWKSKRELLVDRFFIRSETRSLEQSLIEKESNMEITEAVFSLKIKLREAILLYYFADQTTKEISEMLDTPESPIKSRLQKGRKELKAKLRHYEWEGLIDESRESNWRKMENRT